MSQCLWEVSAFERCLPMGVVSVFIGGVCLRKVSANERCLRVYESCLFAGGVFLPEVSSYRVSFHGKSLNIESVHGRRNDCGKFAEI